MKSTRIIEIKYFHKKLKKIKKFQGGDWVDLRSAATITLKRGDYGLIPLGVAMQLPPGCEAHVLPRSSTFKNFGIILLNHMGVIDNSYRGDNDQWFFNAYCIKEFAEIKFNDRICQFRIIEKQPGLQFHERETFNTKDRGGFGSTGIK